MSLKSHRPLILRHRVLQGQGTTAMRRLDSARARLAYLLLLLLLLPLLPLLQLLLQLRVHLLNILTNNNIQRSRMIEYSRSRQVLRDNPLKARRRAFSKQPCVRSHHKSMRRQRHHHLFPRAGLLTWIPTPVSTITSIFRHNLPNGSSQRVLHRSISTKHLYHLRSAIINIHWHRLVSPSIRNPSSPQVCP
jgi:hypothetical protein